MLHDRDDRNRDNEESEYHFSEDDVGYDVETEQQGAAPTSTPKENWFNRIRNSKRMMISLAVFLVLVFVVYKMISPSAETPVTDMTTADVTHTSKLIDVSPTKEQQSGVIPARGGSSEQDARLDQKNSQISLPSQLLPQQQQSLSQQQAQQSQPLQLQSPQASQQSPSAQALQQAQSSQSPQAAQQAQSAQQQFPQQALAPAQAQSSSSVQPVATDAGSQSVPQPIQQMQQAVMSPSQTTSSALGGSSTSGNASQSNPSSPLIDAGLPKAGDRPMSQFEAEYAQKLNESAAQNKALQDQLQGLNARVGAMEAEISQLVQILTRQNQANTPQASGVGANADQNAASPQAQTPAEQSPSDQKLSFEVQAIIPGRAWLKGENGETVTVAEGDVIKDVGRITKIDPYDGVVQINTGNKVVSLSYGNG